MSATKTFACSECGNEFDYEPVEWRGRELSAPTICALCGEEQEREERRRAEQDRFEERLRTSGLPAGLHGFDYSGFTHAAAVNAAKQWASGEIPGLCLTGSVGVGKTRLAAAATWERLHGKGTKWVSVARLLTQLRSGFGDNAKAEASSIVAGKGAIVLDDLDKVNPTDYGREVIFATLDGRVEEGAPLLVTTNLPPSEIGERLGDAVMSRLVGYCRVVEMGGEDRRVA